MQTSWKMQTFSRILSTNNYLEKWKWPERRFTINYLEVKFLWKVLSWKLLQYTTKGHIKLGENHQVYKHFGPGLDFSLLLAHKQDTFSMVLLEQQPPTTDEIASYSVYYKWTVNIKIKVIEILEFSRCFNKIFSVYCSLSIYYNWLYEKLCCIWWYH